MKTILVCLIRFYQVSFSHILGGCCRFYPTCSEYSLQAIRRHGSLKGAKLAAIRLCKCRPFHPGGFDPVPVPDADFGRKDMGPADVIHDSCEVSRIP